MVGIFLLLGENLIRKADDENIPDTMIVWYL
jgi:hypothetical protein